MAKFFFWCFLAFISTTQTVIAASASIVLNDAAKTITLGRQLATLRTQEDGLAIQQISSLAYHEQFRPNAVDATNYGYHDRDFWLRFNVKAASEVDWYLVLDYVVFGEAELFVLPQRSDIAVSIQEQSVPFFLPVRQYRTPAWKLQLPQDQQFTFYLRIRSFKEPLVLPLKLMPEQQFLVHSQYRYIFFTMVVTGVAVLLVYNLFLTFSLRDKSYLILVFLLFLSGIFVYRPANLLPSVFGLLVGDENKYYLSLSFLTHAVGFYYWHILHRNADKWLGVFTKGMALIALVLTVIAFIRPQIASYFLLTFIPALLFLPILMVRTIILGHRSTRGSFISMVCLMTAIGIYSPFYTGYFPTYPLILFYLGYFGILLTMLLFSISHADRTRQLHTQAERFEANSKATQNFLTTMSHELRTPMHTILGANELLRTTSLDHAQKSYLNSAELASHQMLNLVDDVLDTARLHSSQAVPNEKKIFNLHELLANIEKIFSIQAKRNNLDLVVNFEGVSCDAVMGHEKYLNQILTNLIGNAIKYTQYGEVVVSVKADGLPGKSNSVYFAVQDTGPGIAVKHQALLFQPFYQVDNKHSRCKDGAGLGLAISYKLVQQMGGELSLDSASGQGSCFFFTLDLPLYHKALNQDARQIQPIIKTHIPVTKERGDSVVSADEPVSPQTQLSDKPLTGLRILLVDDSELNLMIGEKLLTLQGASVVLAQNGKEALQTLSHQLFDAVLMDVSMPDMDGYQTTRLLRENKSLSKLPVIALTAHALAGERAHCLAAGMDDYLSKPFHIGQLITLIKHYCPKT